MTYEIVYFLMYGRLGLLEFSILFALFSIFDAFAGLSKYLARKLHRPHRLDLIFFLLVIAVGISFVVLSRTYTPRVEKVGFNDYIGTPEGRRALEAELAGDLAYLRRLDAAETQARAIEPYFLVVKAVGWLGVFTGMWMAGRQKRSPFLWIPLAFLCNLGVVFWLFRNRYSQASSVGDGALDSVRPA